MLVFQLSTWFIRLSDMYFLWLRSVLFVGSNGASFLCWYPGAIRDWFPVMMRIVIFRGFDFFESRVWDYIDAPREHTGYVRYVRKYSPRRLH